MIRRFVPLLLLSSLLLVACGGTAATPPAATLVQVTPLPTDTAAPPTAVPPTPTAVPPTPTAEPQPTDTPVVSLTEQMDAFVQAEADAGRFSGAVLVLHNGELLLSNAYGLADRAAGTPNTTATRFAIGTLTMPFTAVAVLQLMEQGKLALEDPICNFLEDCPTSWADVQIRHLLSQSSGIAGADAARAYAIAINEGEPTAAALQRLRESELYFEPGSQWPGLQSPDFRLLGLVIESASGQSYASYMQDNIFDPLEMENTALTNDTTNMAVGYQVGMGDRPVSPGDLIGGYAGKGLSSTLEDMARFSQALLAGDLLSPEATELMVDRAAPMSSGWHTGYGWFISNFDGRFLSASMPSRGVVGHNGDMVFLPEDGLVWVILSNESDRELGYIGDKLTRMVLDGGE
jgi:CubicO group peptidase (beta-lactamase class C family)